jgi:integrase
MLERAAPARGGRLAAHDLVAVKRSRSRGRTRLPQSIQSRWPSRSRDGREQMKTPRPGTRPHTRPADGPTQELPIAACCALAGLRLSEALGLAWADVDFDANTIRVNRQLGIDLERVPTKTSASRAPVPLLPALERELRVHRSRQATRDLRFTHRDALVFSTTRGKPQSRRNALRALHHAVMRSG